jgi:CheY-like chemotaxis protein
MMLNSFKAPKTARQVSVLVVDDDPAVRDIIQDRLTALGWNVTTAADGREGLMAVARHRPHVLLLDLHMPVMDGLTALESLRRDPDLCDTCIVIISGSNRASDITRAAACNVADYVTKPFNAVELVGRVQRALQQVKR